MFDFIKKKEKTTFDPKKEEIILTEEQRNQLSEEINNIEASINIIDINKLENHKELASLYEDLGLAYSKKGDTKSAIDSLEKSLEYKLTIGDGYKKLMHLYNLKRAEAARNADDESIDKYMNKMETMRQIAKKVTMGG